MRPCQIVETCHFAWDIFSVVPTILKNDDVDYIPKLDKLG
jgi:hypothetical protein